MRYLSPPLFPVHLIELPSRLTLHAVPCGRAQIGAFEVEAGMVCRPGPTVGYRIRSATGKVLTYMPDHEPALGNPASPSLPRDWTSGANLAVGADLLIHDSQYSSAQYPRHTGWGHSSLLQINRSAALCEVGRLVSFHHDPNHNDTEIDRMIGESITAANPGFDVTAGLDGATFLL